MRTELEHFYASGNYGGNQNLLKDYFMMMGGCAAVSACDSCIYFDRTFGTHLYPFDKENISMQDYRCFTCIMKPYLRPRITGVDRLELFIEGVEDYLHDHGGEKIRMEGFDGNRSYDEAKEAVARQIDDGFPIPFLLLKHQNPVFDDFVWHWFILNGYKDDDRGFQVKAVTYGVYRWLDLKKLWNTGYKRKGGMILFSRGQQNIQAEHTGSEHKQSI